MFYEWNWSIFFSSSSYDDVMYLKILNYLVPVEREIFLKEENTKMYKIIPYFLAKVLIEIPSNIIVSIILACILYFAFGFIW